MMGCLGHRWRSFRRSGRGFWGLSQGLKIEENVEIHTMRILCHR